MGAGRELGMWQGSGWEGREGKEECGRVETGRELGMGQGRVDCARERGG